MSNARNLEDAAKVLADIAAQVRRRREAAGLSQMELAGRADLALRHLQKIEAAEVNVTVRTLAKLATALATDVVSLVAPKAPMAPERGDT